MKQALRKKSKKTFIIIVCLILFTMSFSSILFLTETGSGMHSPNWWNVSWGYRKLITIDHVEVYGNPTNFPILVNITDTDLKNNSQADADDICFVKYSDNITKYNHEIELYNSSTGHLSAWVNVTSLSSTTDTKIWMYYGNAGSSNQQNVYGTWDSHFLAVWHMNDITTSTIKDSTSRKENGTKLGVNTPLQTNGKAGYAQAFNNTNHEVITVSTGYFNFNKYNNVTVEAWILPKTINPSSQQIILHHGKVTTPWINTKLGIESTHIFDYSQGINNTNAGVFGNTVIGWCYGVGRYNGTSQTAFINGAYQGGTSRTGILYNVSCSAVPLYIGCQDGINRWYNGSIDEIRISDIARSNDWILTTYNTINNPSGFLAIGTQASQIYNAPPMFSNENPSNFAVNIPINLSSWNITINDPEGNLMNWTIQTVPYIGNSSGFNVNNGSMAVAFSGLSNQTAYKVFVNVSDGNSWTKEWYVFSTPDSLGNVTTTITWATDTVFDVGNIDYYASRNLTLNRISLSSNYIVFNSTGFYVSSSNEMSIIMNYIAPDVFNATRGSSILNFTANTTGGKVWFNLSGFKPSVTYIILVDGIQNCSVLTNAEGYVNFSYSSWSEHIFEITRERTTVNTNDATGVGTTNATLQGTLIDDGGEACRVRFQYGLTKNYGITTVNQTKATTFTLWDNQTTAPFNVELYAGYHTRHANKFVSFNGMPIQVDFYLSKTGSPTGLMYGRIRYVSNDTIYDSDSYNVSLLPYGNNWVTFTFSNTEWINSQDIYISAEYSGGDASNKIVLHRSATGDFSYYYDGSWHTDGYKATYRLKYHTNIFANFISNVHSLLPGRLYHYRAVANNTNSVSYGSDKTFLMIPNAPTHVTTIILNETRINISWTKGTTSNYTRIQYNTTGYPSSISDGTNIYNNTGSYIIINNLSQGQVYCFSLWSFSKYGSLNQWSNTYATIIALMIPGPPTNCLMTQLAWRNSSIQINWTKGNGADRTVILSNYTHYAANHLDGATVYNDTGTSTWIHGLDLSKKIYFTVFSYTNHPVPYYNLWSVSYDVIWGGLLINVFNESNPAQSIGFNLLITNHDGSRTYQQNNLFNLYYINILNLPYGENTVFIISNSSYRQRMYYEDLEINTFYNFSFYLPLITPGGGSTSEENKTQLYLFTVYNRYGQTLQDVKIDIKRYINSTDSYESMSILLTDAAGQADVFLIPYKLYKFVVSKNGFITTDSYWTPTPLIQTHTFILDYEIVIVNETIDPYDVISFTAGFPINNVTLTVDVDDSTGNLTDATIYIYENKTLIYSIDFSSTPFHLDYVNNATSPNNNRSEYYVILEIHNHSQFPSNYYNFTIIIQRSNPHGLLLNLDIDLTGVLGDPGGGIGVHIGWLNVFLCGLGVFVIVSFGRYWAGIGIAAMGLVIGLIEFTFGLPGFTGIQLISFVGYCVIMGSLVEIGKAKQGKVGF